MELLEALSDETLVTQIERQREKVKAVQDDYWELVCEQVVRGVRKEMPEAGYLRLEADEFTNQLGLDSVYDKAQVLLADWDSMGAMGKHFGAVNDELADGFLFEYGAHFGSSRQAVIFSLDERVQVRLATFEARTQSL